MTFLAVKKLAIKLPLKERMKLAEAMLETLPPMRKPSTLAELEARADDVLSGKVKALPESALDAQLDAQERMIRQRRLRQRG